MKILIVSYYFPPVNVIGAVRVGKFAKYLAEHGHEVRVLAAHDRIYPADLPTEIPERGVTRTEPVQINLLPYRLLGRPAPSVDYGDQALNPIVRFLAQLYRMMFNFPDGQIGWLPSAMKAGRQQINSWKPDLIYASAVPFTSLIIARRLSAESGVPFVAELRDLWMDSHYYDHPWLRRIIEERLERRVLSAASGLVTVSEPLADTLRLKYGIRTTVTLNGFDPADFVFEDERASWNSDVLRIVYTGTIYPGRRDPTPLFRALSTMGEERRNYRVEFYGRRLTTVRQLAEDHDVSDIVSFHEPIPYRDALRLQADADVLLLLLWDTPEEHGVYTGKLFEYLGARRPVLSIGAERGVAAELITERDAGLVSNDPNTIRAQLAAWYQRKRAGQLEALDSRKFEDLTRAQQFRSLNGFLAGLVPEEGIEPLDIHVVVNRLNLGGTERHLSQVLPRLDPRRFRVRVQVLRANGMLEPALKRAGVPVDSPPPWLPNWAQRLSAGVSLTWQLLFRRPDVLHFFLPESYLFGGFLGLATLHRNMVMSRRSLNHYQARYPFLSGIERWMHQHMAVLVGNSRAVVQQLDEETGGIGHQRLIYNGIETRAEVTAEARAAARRVLGVDDVCVVFVILANLIPYKGYDDLLRGFAAVRNGLRKPWRLYCVGRDDGIGDGLRALAKELELDAHIRWEGEKQDVHPHLAAADVGILASHEEGFSNSVLEGMMAALPMIVTDVGGNAEAVVDGETGLVVPPHEPEALGTAILRLANDTPLRTRLGAAGRQRVETTFALDRCVGEYEKLYNDIACPSQGRQIGSNRANPAKLQDR